MNYCRVIFVFRIRLWLLFAIAFINLYRTIPIRISKKSCDVTEVHNGEMGFPVLLSDSCTTTDNLLELGHRVDSLVKHNELHHLAVNSCRQKFAGCCDDGVFGCNRDEIIKL